jgi:hypothetical protein
MYNKRRINPYVYVRRQKELIERDFDCFLCKTKGKPGSKQLECYGVLQPTEESEEYIVLIEYDGEKSPSVYVIKPILQLDIDAHMYSDGSLCLYYPDEDPWRHKKNIADTIIPWTAEWLVYYELYQITGKWLGPYVPHGEDKDSLKNN